MGRQFEGDMLKMTNYAAALATALEAAAASSGCPRVELIRKESLSGLTPEAVYKVLAHAYSAVVTINPLQPPALPVAAVTLEKAAHAQQHGSSGLPTSSAGRDLDAEASANASPAVPREHLQQVDEDAAGGGCSLPMELPLAYHGASDLMLSPWLPLMVCHQLRQGPPALVLVMGQRLARLPPQLQDCTHALILVRAECVVQLQKVVSCAAAATIQKAPMI